MIEFTCENCGQKLRVEDKHAGKRIKCPKCGGVGAVPDNSDKIKFHCESCGQSIRVPAAYAGKKGKCPKCKTAIVVPSLEKEPPGSAPPDPPIPSYADEDSYEDEPDLPEEDEGVDRRLIIAICGGAAVVVVGLIILVTVILPSGSEPAAPESQPTQPFVQEPARDTALPSKSAPSGEGPFAETRIAFSSDGDGDYEIYIMNADGTGLKKLTDDADDELFPSWSPDARKIAFESRKDGNPDICVMNADGSEQTNLTNNSSRHHVPSWSPDGQRIVFYSYDDNDHEIQVMNSDGSGLKQLTDNHANDMAPSWSPDGMRIAFCSERDGNFEIYDMDVDGGDQRRLTDNAARDMGPVWSPDGGKIAFDSNRDDNHEIYVMNPDGTEQRRLTDNAARDGNPCWSPDGKEIAFVSDRDGNREIYVMNADGSEQTRLTDNPAGDSWPAWSPVLASRSQPATSGKSYATGNLDLKLRLRPGQKHNVRIVSEDTGLASSRGQQYKTTRMNDTVLGFEVEQVDADGVVRLKVTFLTIHEIRKTGDHQTEYDSTKPDTVEEYYLGPELSAMIGKSFVAEVGPRGKTFELEGVDEMFSRIAETLVDAMDEANSKRTAKAMARETSERLKRSVERANRERRESRDKRIETKRKRFAGDHRYGKDRIREMIGHVIMPFPDGPVGIGDSWKAPTVLPTMRAIDLDDSTYTLREYGQAGTLVDMVLKIDRDDETASGKDEGDDSERMTLTGSYEGSMAIDPSSGWTLSREVIFRCSGQMTIAPTERNPQGMTLPISSENITTVKTIEEPSASRRQDAADVDSQSYPAAAPSDAARNLDLKLRLKPGQKHRLQVVKEINSSQTTKGRQFDEEYINTMGLEIEVQQVESSGVAWLKVTYLTIHEKIEDARAKLTSAMGNTSEYDSTKPETAVSYMNYGPLFTAMIGQSFRARVTPEGEIVELDGLAEMYARMAELVVENEDEATRQKVARASPKNVEERANRSIDQSNQHYGSREKRIETKRERLADSGHTAKGLLREMLANVIMPFPEGPLGTGDSWQGKTALFSMGAGDVGLDDCTYTLRENKQSAMLVDFSSKIEVDDELLSGERGSPGAYTITLAGSCQGSLEIDPGSGWILHKTVTMHCSGESKIAPAERLPQGLTTVMSMETVTTIKPFEEPIGALASESPREETAVKMPTGSPAAARDDTGNLDLRLRLKPGQKHNLQIVREENTSQTVGKQPQNTNRTMTTELGFEVEQVEPNGVARLRVTYRAIHEVIKMASRQIEYDSAKPDTAASYPFGSILSTVTGQSFVAKVTPKGEIVELEGLDDMYRRMAEPVVDIEDERIRQRMVRKQTENPEEDARRAIDEENRKYGSRERRIEGAGKKLEKGPHAGVKDIREMLGHVIMPFPGGPVGTGDSWQARTALFSIASVGLDDCTYTLRESKQTVVLVDISSKIELADEPISGEGGLFGSARATLAGSCEGSVETDPSNGWMLHKNVTMRYSGEVKIAHTEPTPKVTTQPVSMEIVTTVKTIE